MKTQLGIASPVKFDDGTIGWQIVAEDGLLAAIINHRGAIGEVYDFGNCSWGITEETAEHRELIQIAVDRSEFGDFPFWAEGYTPTPIPEI